MAQFEFALLGTPRFYAHGQSIHFATRKAQALLTFLAVEGTPVSRDKLIDLFWVESDAERGRVSLRTTLSQVRRGLNERVSDATAAAVANTLIVAEKDVLAINPYADCHLDVHLVDKAYALSRSYKAGTIGLKDLRPTLERAATSYAGDFLDGFSSGDASNFDDWASLQREKWHTRFSTVLGQLSQLQFEGGEFAAGIETANRWVMHDALNEIAHRRLMQLHVAAGNRAGALHAYEACQAILARELNANPSPETEALAERLRAHILPTASIDVVAEPTRESARLRVASTALIGRVQEHHDLVQAFRAARDGEPQVVVIQGEPGIGKTRLAQEFLGWAAAQGAVVTRTAAYPSTLNAPYQVWVDAFRKQVSQPEGRDAVRAALDALEPVWVQALAQLLPELAIATSPADAMSPAGQAERAAASSQSQLLESVFRLVQRLTQPSASAVLVSLPRVIYVDDVQWVDAASLELLDYLVRRCAEEAVPTLTVMTLRDEAAKAFEPTLRALRCQASVTTMRLSALTQADSDHVVLALLAQTFPQSVRDDPSAQIIQHFAQALFAETAGHPLYLLETFKSLFESTALADAITDASTEGEQDIETELTRWQETLEGWLAPGVKDVIQSRLDRVSPRVMTLIQTVAVLGQGNDFETCRQTANLNEDDALILLDDTLRRGLLRESVRGAISFTHDKISEVVYAGLSASRRRSLHRRSAEVLERRHADHLDDYAPLIARHFDASDDGRALAYFGRAANAAAKVYAYREAAAHYARAIELAVSEESGLGATERRNEMRAAIAGMHFKQYSMHVQLANYHASIETMRCLAKLAREWHDPALEQATRVWIAPNLALPGPHMQLGEAEQLANQILPQARAAQSLPDEVQALRTLMRVALWRTQFDLAAHYGQTIFNLVDEWPTDPLYGYILNDMAAIALHRHEFDAAHRYQQAAITLWRVLDRPSIIVTSLMHACLRALCCGEYEAAIAFSQEALGISGRVNSDWTRTLALARVGSAFFELGQVDQAIALMRENIRISQLAGQTWNAILTSVELAGVYGKLGEVSVGLQVAHAAYQAASTMKEWRPYIIPALVHLYVLQHELSEAEAWLAQGRGLMEGKHDWPAVQIMLDAAAAELVLAQGDSTQASALSRACVTACRDQGWRHQLPSMLLLLGRALHAQGRVDDATEALDQAAEEARATHAQWSLQEIQKMLGV
jgi:DNA-binding SARP family transcriptional activator